MTWTSRLAPAAALGATALCLTACGGSDSSFINTSCDDALRASCMEISGGDAEGLLEAVQLIGDDTTIVLGAGTFALDNQVTIRANQVTLVGQGMDETVLDFGSITTQSNGVDVVGDDFIVEDLEVLDAPKDGIRVEDSDGVVYRRIRTTWTNAEDPDAGAYGIYPVSSTNVLVEDNEAFNAADAGLYVGQCQNVIVRNNLVSGNVAGLEIENTQYADVYGNTVENNTGGILVFDLPGNRIVGRDVMIRDNDVRNNNVPNFAPGGVVSEIPAGSGTVVFASRRVEIRDNTYENNNTMDISLVSGLLVESDAERWEHRTDELVGDWEDLGLDEGQAEGTVTNFRTENIVVAGNSHSGGGTSVDTSVELGQLLALTYLMSAPGVPVDSIVYDGFGESSFDPSDPGNNSNDNHICAGENTDGTMVSLDVESQLPVPSGSPVLRLPDPLFAPFDCTSLEGDPIEVPATL